MTFRLNFTIYRDYRIHPAFEGWKVETPTGAWWPEKYQTPDDARKSIEKELK